MNPGNRIGLALAGLALLVATPLSAEDAAYDLDIESQPLAAALKEFAEQSGLQVVYYSELADGVQSHAVAGAMTADQAMTQLLASTDLTFDTMGDDTVVVEEVAAQIESEVTSKSGNSRSASGVMMMAQTRTNSSESRDQAPREGESSPIDEEVERLEEIIVTGTNIRGFENPTTPVLEFDREDIELSGAATVEQFLETIPQNFRSETPLTINSANPFNSNLNTSQGTAVDLRGLGPGTTLTLLNGRRMTASGLGSFVDVSVLPLGVIERVEILTDGSSAIYGSDAVGGVVNFITRTDYEGFDVSARYGSVTDGSREEYSVGGAGGINWGSGGGFIGVDYQDSKPLLSSERDFIDQSMANPTGTLGAETDRVSVAASINQGITDRLSIHLDSLYSDRSAEIEQQQFGLLTVLSEQEAVFFNSRFDYEVSDSITAQLFFDYSQEEVELDISGSDPSDDDLNVLENDMLTVEALISGGLFEGPGGAVAFALGASYREESFDQISNFDTVDGGESVSSPSRDVVAVFGELLFPLVSEANDISWLEELTLSLAARYEDYSDFGETANPKIGVQWAPYGDLSIRASYSESFRAPILSRQEVPGGGFFQPFPTAFITAFDPPAQDGRLQDGTTALLVLFGSGADLTEETAEAWTAGLDYKPIFAPSLSMSLNYFDIAYSNRIENVDFFFPLQDPAYSNLVQSPPSAGAFSQEQLDSVFNVFPFLQPGATDFLNPTPAEVQVFVTAGIQNIAERDVRGLDLQARYEKDTSVGDFTFSFGGSYLLEYESRVSELSDTSDDLNVLYRPIDLNMRASLGWSRNGLNAVAAINYTDGYRDNIDSSIANDIDSWTTFDLVFAYETDESFAGSIAENTVLRLSIQNLFDEEPPFVATSDGLNFDTANADPFGRFISLAVSKRL